MLQNYIGSDLKKTFHSIKTAKKKTKNISIVSKPTFVLFFNQFHQNVAHQQLYYYTQMYGLKRFNSFHIKYSASFWLFPYIPLAPYSMAIVQRLFTSKRKGTATYRCQFCCLSQLHQALDFSSMLSRAVIMVQSVKNRNLFLFSK